MSKKQINHLKYTKYMEYLQQKLDNNYDVEFRKLQTKQGEICAVYVDTLCDGSFISEYVISPLLQQKEKMPSEIEAIKGEVLFANTIGDVEDEEACLIHILSGDVVLLFSFLPQVIFCVAQGFETRALEVPPTENVIKGPREGFTEDIHVNISLLRRRIRNSQLKLESFYLGKESNTQVILAYIEGLSPEDTIHYVRKSLQSIDANFLLASNYIEEILKCKRTLFDTVGYTEKPDILAAKLGEGRVGIFTNGTPFVLTLPYFFTENFDMADDYYQNKYGTSYDRIIRWAAFLIGVTLPGLYLALTTYHFGLIPSTFVFRLAVLRAGVPYPAVIEILIMMFFFQILREAGVRLPKPVGAAISIVGALILGEAAIGAGFTSEVTVLVIALSSIATFLVPTLYSAMVIWCNVIIFFSAFLGLPGFFVGFIVFVSHLAGLTSCGYPFLFPVGTYRNYRFKDHFFRYDLKEISKNLLSKDDVR